MQSTDRSKFESKRLLVRRILAKKKLELESFDKDASTLRLALWIRQKQLREDFMYNGLLINQVLFSDLLYKNDFFVLKINGAA